MADNQTSAGKPVRISITTNSDSASSSLKLANEWSKSSKIRLQINMLMTRGRVTSEALCVEGSSEKHSCTEEH